MSIIKATKARFHNLWTLAFVMLDLSLLAVALLYLSYLRVAIAFSCRLRLGLLNRPECTTLGGTNHGFRLFTIDR